MVIINILKNRIHSLRKCLEGKPQIVGVNEDKELYILLSFEGMNNIYLIDYKI